MGSPDAALTATVREVRCKDCLRERRLGWNDPDARQSDADEQFEYNEAWAQGVLGRGGSRTDRCPRHRRLHRQEISGLAVAYIDLKTIGEVADRENPMGPLGGLGPLPTVHRPVPKAAPIPFSKFGMTDDHVREIYKKMANPQKRVLILKAGTGTGKSTFFPFRLLSPPDGVDFSFTEHGPIVVTEPRVQATVGVARYVGERLVMGCPLMECSEHGSFNPKSHVDDPLAPAGETCTDPEHCDREHVGDHPGPKSEACRVSDCTRHIGPGYPVGYQVKGDARHDPATQLVYVTDGTMINWLREGRLNKIGTVVVDEAHERSTNIDFIMGYLRREIDRYPHLRVIVTSATFDVPFYEDYFGGPDRVECFDVPAKKAFGYGAPLFPVTDGPLECGCERDENGNLPHKLTTDPEEWLHFEGHWPDGETIPDTDVAVSDGDLSDDSSDEDSDPETLRAITRQLLDLRLPQPPDRWPEPLKPVPRPVLDQMVKDLADHVVRLANALDDRAIYGDILAFLPNNRLIESAVTRIEQGVDREHADVYALIQSAPTEQKEAALESRPRGAKRKIVVSTNLAETSLTVSGVRFVVDTGLTTQGDWDPVLASKSVPTTLHSQAGVRQRWGRVGRDAPGWVFPLYSRAQFDELPRDTPPGSTRDNLEQLVMKAKAAGIDDVAVSGFKWPAAHKFGQLDASAERAADIFTQELERASHALEANGAVDAEGHLTSFGKELERFGQHSAGFAIAAMFADQLACLPEVLTALSLLEAQKPQGFEDVDLRNLPLFDHDWPGAWRVLADQRWQQLHVGCRDDLDLALRIVGLWERADPDRRPWEPSPARETWARRWWLNHDVLLKLAELRRQDLEGLSPAMKEEVKRFLEPKLAPRARAVISRAFVDMLYRTSDEASYTSVARPDDPPASISGLCRLPQPPRELLALTRQTGFTDEPEIRNVVEVTPWAADPALDATDLLLLCAEHCAPRTLLPSDYDHTQSVIRDYPVGSTVDVNVDTAAQRIAVRVYPQFAYPIAAEPPDGDETTSWPIGNLAPIEDQEEIERVQVVELDDDDRDDTSGRALGLEVNDDEPLPTARTINVLDDSTSHDDRSAVELVSAGQRVTRSGVFRCIGYYVTPRGTAVELEPLAVEQAEPEPDPASHPDLAFGASVEVVVGETLEVQRRKLRVLERTDGRGRFFLCRGKFGTGNPPIALDSFHQQVAEDLGPGARIHVEVVPTAYGTTGVTLIPALSRHLDKARSRQASPPAGSAGVDPRPLWNATLVEVPNHHGFAAVELLARDETSGVRQRFSVRVQPGTPHDGTLDAVGQSVGLRLSWNTRARLYPTIGTASEQLRAFATTNPKHLKLVEPADEPGAFFVTPRRPIASDLRERLLQLDADRSWQHRVWEFYLRSYLRVNATLEPGNPGEQTVHLPLVATASPPSAEASHQASGLVPDAWLHMFAEPGLFRFQRSALHRLCGGRVHSSPPATVHFEWETPEEARRGLSAFHEVARYPVASVPLSSKQIGAVIGPKGAYIQQLGAIDGVFSCMVVNDDQRLYIAARDSHVIRTVLDDVRALLGITMTVPDARQNGILIGRAGEEVKRLCAESGCLYAHASHDSADWTVLAPTYGAVQRFVALANAKLPGCTLRDHTPKLTVSDHVLGRTVEDWSRHTFAPATVPTSWAEAFEPLVPPAPGAGDQPSPIRPSVEPSLDRILQSLGLRESVRAGSITPPLNDVVAVVLLTNQSDAIRQRSRDLAKAVLTAHPAARIRITLLPASTSLNHVVRDYCRQTLNDPHQTSSLARISARPSARTLLIRLPSNIAGALTPSSLVPLARALGFTDANIEPVRESS
ncbi:MAG: hypothetical protein ITG02_15410 [Patulibacter sp.]|nr:hypothetical protein [Patulibacter sp.]